MMRLAARAVQQMIQPRAQDEIGLGRAVVQQVRRPVGDAHFRLIRLFNQQVVVDLHIAGQRRVKFQINQVDKRLLAHLDNLAAVASQRQPLWLGHVAMAQLQGHR